MALHPQVQAFVTAVKGYFTQIGSSIDGIVGDSTRQNALIAKLQADATAEWTPENQAVLDEIDALGKSVASSAKSADDLNVPAPPPDEPPVVDPIDPARRR